MALAFKAETYITEKGKNKKQSTIPTSALANDTRGHLTLMSLTEDVKQLLIDTAYSVLQEELREGFPEDFTTIVDGSKGKKLIEEVKPFGKIEFVAPAFALEVLKDTAEHLIARSKVDTGNYMRSFQVRVDNVIVADDWAAFRTWYKKLESGQIELRRDSVITFVNTAPYARKLERYGITSSSGKRPKKKRTMKSKTGRPERMLAPNGVFYLTSRVLRRKYPQVGIMFDFITGARLGGRLTAATFKTNRGSGKGGLNAREKKNPRTYLYPAITIRLKAGGIK